MALSDFFDPLETMPVEKRRAFQERHLRLTVSYAYQNAPAVKKIFDNAGVLPRHIRTLKDLEKVPITRKTDLIELQRKHPPYGGFLTIPTPEVERIFISPGPIYEPHQSQGIKWFAKSFWAAGFRQGDIVINTFTYHMSPAGILFHEGIRHCGATAIPMGTGGTDILVQTLRDLRVTGFVGTPTFLMTVIKRAEEMGLDLRRDFALKRAWFTGEMLPASLRKTLEQDYHISTSQAYAVTEPGGAIAYECQEKSGMHFMDDYIIEIVSPDTGEQLGPGEVGEIVVTPIHNKAWGLVRFGTGDLCSFSQEPCSCGRTADRLLGIVGRASDAVKVRGMFVVARQAEQVLAGFPNVSRFQFAVGRKAQRDEIVLRVEMKDESNDWKTVESGIDRSFQDICRLKLDRIERVAKGAIPEQHKTIVDSRQWD